MILKSSKTMLDSICFLRGGEHMLY